VGGGFELRTQRREYRDLEIGERRLRSVTKIFVFDGLQIGQDKTETI
jgi:hypothetical protein